MDAVHTLRLYDGDHREYLKSSLYECALDGVSTDARYVSLFYNKKYAWQALIDKILRVMLSMLRVIHAVCMLLLTICNMFYF
jgi:hypothetical protein